MRPALEIQSPFAIFAFIVAGFGLILAIISVTTYSSNFMQNRSNMKYSVRVISLFLASGFLLFMRLLFNANNLILDVLILSLLFIGLAWLAYIVLGIVFYNIEWPAEYKRYESIRKIPKL